MSCVTMLLYLHDGLYCKWMVRDRCGTPDENLLTVFLLVESILFGLFTFCMMSDQWSSLSTNQTHIDRLKNQKHEIQVRLS